MLELPSPEECDEVLAFSRQWHHKHAGDLLQACRVVQIRVIGHDIRRNLHVSANAIESDHAEIMDATRTERP